MGIIMEHTEENITKAGITLSHTTKMRTSSNLFSRYFIFNLTRNLSELLSSMNDGPASRSQIDDLSEASVSIRVKEEVGAQVWERSAAVDESLQNATYLYMEHADHLLTNITQYTKLKNLEKLVICNLQSEKLSRLFQSLSTSVAATINIVEPEPPIGVVVEQNE